MSTLHPSFLQQTSEKRSGGRAKGRPAERYQGAREKWNPTPTRRQLETLEILLMTVMEVKFMVDSLQTHRNGGIFQPWSLDIRRGCLWLINAWKIEWIMGSRYFCTQPLGYSLWLAWPQIWWIAVRWNPQRWIDIPKKAYTINRSDFIMLRYCGWYNLLGCDCSNP